METTTFIANKVVMREEDLSPNINLVSAINELRHRLNAVILAHYYQDASIQDVADFVGDSLDLSQKAASAKAEVIVFAGVRFMAEVAKILSPNRLVLLPDNEAGCSLESSCLVEDLAAFRFAHPNHLIVSYINCSAEVKALSDFIVTSSNAENILLSLPLNRLILFVPDRNLGEYLSRKIGRNLMLWPGICEVHDSFSLAVLAQLKKENPEAVLAAHPECPQIILEQAEHIGGTRSLLNFISQTSADTIIIATDPHILHQMLRLAPNKKIIPLLGRDRTPEGLICPYMAKNTLIKLYLCMVNQQPRIEMSIDLIKRARLPLERMLQLSS